MRMFCLVFGVMCAACILSVVAHIYLQRYFRYRHPKIWLTFGFRGDGVFVEAQDEVSSLVAQRRFRKFLRSGERARLQDAKLNRVVSITKAINLVALVLFGITIAFGVYLELRGHA